jgi:hypothetical protein
MNGEEEGRSVYVLHRLKMSRVASQKFNLELVNHPRRIDLQDI